MSNSRSNSTTSALSQALVPLVLEDKKDEDQSLPPKSAEFKAKLEEIFGSKHPQLLAKHHDEWMIKQGKKKFYAYEEARIRQSKKDNLDADINFDNEDKAKLLADPQVRAFLRQRPEAKFVPADVIHTLEHNDGIGEVDKKGKQTAPAILTVSNAPIEKIILANYGINLDQLLAANKLSTIKIGLTFVPNPEDSTGKTPVFAYHLTSGPEKEKRDTRDRENNLIAQIQVELLKKHEFIYSGGDSQVNHVVLKDGKPQVENGRMVLNKEIKEVLNKITLVTVARWKPSKPKIKKRGARDEQDKSLGLSTVSNQQEKGADASAKIEAKTIVARKADDLPNGAVVNSQPLPVEGSEKNLATGKKVSDHHPVADHKEGEKIIRIFSGGLLQEGPKEFQDPHAFYNQNAFVKDNEGNDVVSYKTLRDSTQLVAKFYALLVSNCLKTKLFNPEEKPRLALKEYDTQKTSLSYMEDFYNLLAKINIDPLKSSEDLLKSVDFNNADQMMRLNNELSKFGERFTESKKDVRKFCMALNNTGIDPFKTEEEIMSTYDARNEDHQKILVEATNKILQVQALDDLDPIKEEKSENQQVPHADLAHQLRAAFKNTVIELQKSDEFEKYYFYYATDSHVQLHGYSHRVEIDADPDLIPYELAQDIQELNHEKFNKVADSIVGEANARTPNGGRSPINKFFQTAFNMELAGGFVKVANKTPNSREVTLSVCIENALLFVSTDVSGDEGHILIHNITEAMESKAKPGVTGKLYAQVITQSEAFYAECRNHVLSQDNQYEQTQGQVTMRVYSGGERNRYASFSTPPASPQHSPTATVSDEPQQRQAVTPTM